MSINISTKERAIQLRKDGKTYSEILKEIPVAKSTLSEWFKEVNLSKRQIQKLTEKKLAASKRGGIAKRLQRLNRIKNIREEALKDIKHISDRELWLIGIVLYWAEGSKEKEYHPGSRLNFSNSDANMIKLYLKWLREVCKVMEDKIELEIYIHENSKNDIEKVKKYWSKVTNFSINRLRKIYYKKNKIKTNRRNKEDLYYGGIRVTVKSSSGLVRQVAGWTEAIYKNI